MKLNRNDWMTLRVGKLWQSADKVPVVLHARVLTGIAFVMTCCMPSMENDNKSMSISWRLAVTILHPDLSKQRGLALIQMVSDIDAARLVFIKWYTFLGIQPENVRMNPSSLSLMFTICRTSFRPAGEILPVILWYTPGCRLYPLSVDRVEQLYVDQADPGRLQPAVRKWLAHPPPHTSRSD